MLTRRRRLVGSGWRIVKSLIGIVLWSGLLAGWQAHCLQQGVADPT